MMEAVESSAGLVGPALGGILFRMGANVPLVSVVAIYSVVFVAIFLYYRDTIVFRKKKLNVSTTGIPTNVTKGSKEIHDKVQQKKNK